MHYCSNVNERKYIQRCDGIHCIIPVTLFPVLLYNACSMFQHDKTTNLLISVLDCFNLGTTVDNGTFMSTMSKSTNSALILKQDNNKQFCIYSILHPPLLYLQLGSLGTFTIQQILSQLKLKKNNRGTDRGEMLIFQQFIHSWLCYELVKVLYVFGLLPQIRSGISGWTQELHAAFNYLNNKQHKHKETALKVHDILFDKTKHNSYFN
jgi:hypothetical protein